MDTNINELIDFFKFFRSVVKKINDNIPNKTKIISFNDILYCCLYRSGNSCSYSLTNINMCMNNIIDVSKVSLIKKRDSINFVYFKKICNEILNFIYKDHDKQRIIGVDGTYIPLSIELKKYGFTTSNKNTYCIGLVSSLFDLNDEVLINYRLCKNHNEREGLLKQIKYLRS